MDKRLKDKIESEISRIDRLFENGKPLLESCKVEEPGFTERFAISFFLQSFYTGIESIVELIFKHYGEDVTFEKQWHKRLLAKTFEPTEKRTRLFNDGCREPLEEYLTFRHFSRHSYGIELDWKRLEPLVSAVENAWGLTRQDILAFIGNY